MASTVCIRASCGADTCSCFLCKLVPFSQGGVAWDCLMFHPATFDHHPIWSSWFRCVHLGCSSYSFEDTGFENMTGAIASIFENCHGLRGNSLGHKAERISFSAPGPRNTWVPWIPSPLWAGLGILVLPKGGRPQKRRRPGKT